MLVSHHAKRHRGIRTAPPPANLVSTSDSCIFVYHARDISGIVLRNGLSVLLVRQMKERKKRTEVQERGIELHSKSSETP